MEQKSTTPAAWDEMVSTLRQRGIAFTAGLTDPEISSAETRFGFRFPPDLRAFLQTALPNGPRFPDWRAGDETTLRDWLDLPKRGMLFDVQHNAFWLDEWGSCPQDLGEAKRVVERLIAAAPRLIPVYMHRMMPAEPHVAGNPVFSVHQTDIIIYGTDLRDYLAHEFMTSRDDEDKWRVPRTTRPIAFWDTERFQAVRWGSDGKRGCVFDNSRGLLP